MPPIMIGQQFAGFWFQFGDQRPANRLTRVRRGGAARKRCATPPLAQFEMHVTRRHRLTIKLVQAMKQFA